MSKKTKNILTTIAISIVSLILVLIIGFLAYFNRWRFMKSVPESKFEEYIVGEWKNENGDVWEFNEDYSLITSISKSDFIPPFVIKKEWGVKKNALTIYHYYDSDCTFTKNDEAENCNKDYANNRGSGEIAILNEKYFVLRGWLDSTMIFTKIHDISQVSDENITTKQLADQVLEEGGFEKTIALIQDTSQINNENITTEQLADRVLESEHIPLIFSRNSNQQGFEFLRRYDEGLQLLMARPDASEVLLEKYSTLDIENTAPKMLEEDNSTFLFKVFFLEMILSQDEIIKNTDQAELDRLARKVFTQKEKNLEYFGSSTLESTQALFINKDK